jgi:DNA-binding IclR family transcriptional regulator
VFQIMNTPERVVAILDEMASAGGPCGVSEISRLLGIGKNNVFRILAALEEKGWVTQDAETKKYGLTGALVEVAFRALSQLDIQKISLPYLHELQAITGETSALVIRVGLERMFVSSVPSNHEISHLVPLGKSSELWYGSGGKAILAFMAEDEVEAVLTRFKNAGISALPAGQPVSAESLRKELAAIRKQGFAAAAGARTSGVCGVSAPIFDHKQQVAGAISVSGPMPRFDMEKALQYSTLVIEKAEKISSIRGAKAG